MNEKKLFRALSNIDDDLIEAASRPPKRNPLLIYLPTAAAACLCIVIGLFAFLHAPENGTDGIAARSGVGIPSATEAHAVSLDPTKYGDFQGISIAPTGAPAGNPVQGCNLSEVPADLSFRLNWNGGQYSSEDCLYIRLDGSSCSLVLTEEETQAAWHFIEESAKEEPSADAAFILDYTANGNTYHLQLSASCIPMQKLGELLDEAADRIR